MDLCTLGISSRPGVYRRWYLPPILAHPLYRFHSILPKPNLSSLTCILFRQLEKYKKCDFGRCPRVFCRSHPLLPIGLSDLPHTKSVKLYCAKCEDVYSPKSSRHASIDGAYFGTSFPHILFQVYPALIPPKSNERYTPRCFGFKTHAIAALARWQEQKRGAQDRRLADVGIEVKRLEGEDDPDGSSEGDDLSR